MTLSPPSLTICWRGCALTLCSDGFAPAHGAVDFVAASAGGPTFYFGRDMKLAHEGMGITKEDYAAFMRCLSATMDTFEVPEPERGEVAAFITNLETQIVEA